MIYVWKIVPNNYPEKLVGIYDRTHLIDQFLLNKGQKMEPSGFSSAVMSFAAAKKDLEHYDCLPNNLMIPLVNQRVRELCEEFSPEDVQFFPAQIKCDDGELLGYYFLNVTQKVTGIDHQKSLYKKIAMPQNSFIYNFKHLVYLADCLGQHKLARDQEVSSHLLVSGEIKEIFTKKNITGMQFILPEDLYRQFTYEDLD